MALLFACTGGGAGDGDEEAGADESGPGPDGPGGSPAGERVGPVNMIYPAPSFSPEFQSMARILSEDFEQLGLTIDLEPLDASAFVDIITGRQLEQMAISTAGSDPSRIDPNYWIVDLSTCEAGRNASNWCDPEFDEIARLQSVEVDPARRHELVAEAQARHHADLPWWLLTSDQSGLLYNNERWTNVESPAPTGPTGSLIRPWLTMEPTGDDRILDWVHSEEVTSYNILVEQTAIGWLQRIYDTLLRDDAGEIIPWAATSWEFIDDTTVELTLREGMTFHDGEPLTVEDAVFSYNYLLEQAPENMASALENIESAAAVNDSTMEVRLIEPDAAFTRTSLAFLPILPQHIWDGLEDPLDWDPAADDMAIGSGPFMLDSWVRGQEHILSVHEDHWMAPNYDGMRVQTLSQADAMSAAISSGEADINTSVLPKAEQQRLSEVHEFLDFIPMPNHGVSMLMVNLEVEPFGDYAFRRALRLATDKERLVTEAYIGFATPAGEGPVPTALTEWYDASLEPIPYDMDAARQVLEEAGYTWDDQGNLHLPPGE